MRRLAKGDEISRVNGLRYAKDVMNASTVARLQNYGLVYRRNFDIAAHDNQHYLAKLGFKSTHSVAIGEVDVGLRRDFPVPCCRHPP